MAISLENLKRYKDIARLFAKHGRGMKDMPAELLGEAEPSSTSTTPQAEELVRDLEALGPTFVKLGQVLASRSDLLPVSYVEALSRLQDDVEPFGFAEVEATVESELGVRISKAFSHFESTPLAAASLGQVHRANAARRAPGCGQGAAPRDPAGHRRGPVGARASREAARRAHRPRSPATSSGRWSRNSRRASRESSTTARKLATSKSWPASSSVSISSWCRSRWPTSPARPC